MSASSPRQHSLGKRIVQNGADYLQPLHEAFQTIKPSAAWADRSYVLISKRGTVNNRQRLGFSAGWACQNCDNHSKDQVKTDQDGGRCITTLVFADSISCIVFWPNKHTLSINAYLIKVVLIPSSHLVCPFSTVFQFPGLFAAALWLPRSSSTP